MNFAQTVVVKTTETTSSSYAGFTALWFAWLIFAVFLVVGMWKIFEKADEAGWKSIVPIYNSYTLFRISGRNGLWFLGLLVPLLNIFVIIRLALDLAKHFDRSTAFAIFGLWIFSAIGYLILGFGSSEYVGQKHQ